jgi:hypothetical protein
VHSLPEVRIGDWARTHGIAVDASLASEEREGGTLAVGDDVPAFQRDDLSVFAPAEWEKRKATMSFTAWVAAASAADSAPAPRR